MILGSRMTRKLGSRGLCSMNEKPRSRGLDSITINLGVGDWVVS